MSKARPKWFLFFDKAETDSDDRWVIADTTALNRHVAYLPVSSMPDGEQDENALLLLAAPDLLAACEAAIEATGGSKYWNGETEKFLKLCEAAIAKAQESP